MTKEKANPNKYIWDQLKQTDPRFTKRVNKGFGEISYYSLNRVGKELEYLLRKALFSINNTKPIATPAIGYKEMPIHFLIVCVDPAR